MRVRIVDVTKIFDDPNRTVGTPGAVSRALPAVRNVSLDIAEGEFVTLLGPSGCGKTTTLRMVAGFETPSSGQIYIGDELVNDLPPNRRDTTMVFQSYAIFPHMSVEQNIGFGLELKGRPKKEIHAETHKIMEVMDLGILAQASSRPTLGRSAAASGSGARDRQQTGSPPRRRTPVQPRRQVTGTHALRDQADPESLRHHEPLCDPRPGGGDDRFRQDSRDEFGRAHADRHSLRDIFPPFQSFRRRFHRTREFFRGKTRIGCLGSPSLRRTGFFPPAGQRRSRTRNGERRRP